MTRKGSQIRVLLLPPFKKAVSLMTYGFYFSSVSMLKNFGTFPKHLEKMRKSVGLNPKVCDMQQYVKRNANLTAATDIMFLQSLAAGNPQTYPESARSIPRLPSGAGRFAGQTVYKIFPSGFRGNFLCLRGFPPPLSAPVSAPAGLMSMT